LYPKDSHPTWIRFSRAGHGLFGQPITEAGDRKAQPPDTAADGTGMETTCASSHGGFRAGCKRTRFVTLMVGVLCATLSPCARVVDWGQRRHEACADAA
jgi:hypothetical protein